MQHFTSLDYLVFAAYGLLLLVSGWWFSRARAANSSDYFLGGKTMPTWMVAISVLATSQSAATFLGGPDQGYQGDISYLATNLGALVAALFVMRFLIPRFYQLKVFTVYELLQQRFGSAAKTQAGLMYLCGRVFASGARLYMAALAVAMILYGNIQPTSVMAAIGILAIVGLLYTVIGGIRSVIYSDVIQCAVYVSAALAVVYYLLTSIPLTFSEMLDALQHTPQGTSKLALIKTSWDTSPAGVFNLWSVFTGFVLLNIAAFGLDQDMTQRVLTCKNAREGSKAMLMSVILVIPVMALFILIGLLLYLVYQRPDLMTNGNEPVSQLFEGEKITIFMYYLLHEIPAGIKALVTIGIIAAALSTLNSGLNSMSSVLIQDLYRPWRARQGKALDESQAVFAGQWGMVLMALSLGLMAALCFYWQRYTDMPLLNFALSVMVFSYSGLLGVYFTALFTRRGSPRSVWLALLAGFLSTLFWQPYVQALLLPEHWQMNIGFTWQLCIGTLVSSTVCLLGCSESASIRRPAGNEVVS